MTVLVTGITGRVGSRLAGALLDRGDTVRGLALPDDPLLSRLPDSDHLEVVTGTLQDEEALANAVRGVDAVVHLAAHMVLDVSPLELYDTNVMGTMRLLEAVREQPSPPRFVFASSDGTYGVVRPRYLPIDEQHPQTPGDYYSGSKVLGERLLENYALQFDIPYAILRFSTVIGGEESLGWFRFESTLARLRRAQQGRRSNLWPLFVDHPKMDELVLAAVDDPADNPAVAVRGPSGEPWGMPVTDARDIAQAIMKVLALDDAPNDRFNVAGPMITTDDGARVIAEAMSLPLYEVELPVHWNYEVDTGKAKAAFGYEPEWTFERVVHDALSQRQGAVTKL